MNKCTEPYLRASRKVVCAVLYCPEILKKYNLQGAKNDVSSKPESTSIVTHEIAPIQAAFVRTIDPEAR